MGSTIDACGCGAKIRTPLKRTEWMLTDTAFGPRLWPSVGNWQQACKSHYVIDGGEIIWCGTWTPEQMLAGRRAEEARQKEHYDAMCDDAMCAKKPSLIAQIWRWLERLLRL